MNALRATDLCKTYIVNRRQNNVLRNVNLEIEEGEMVGVMGPSGSGKTTLLYTVSGMDTATAGKVEFFGEEMTSLSANQVSDLRLRRMGFVFQQMYMLKNLSIYDNIVLPAYQSASGKEQRREINERAKVLMAKLGISEVADNDISEVSGGQLQRACIARSMINNPKIIFADEPTGSVQLVQHYPKIIPVIFPSLSTLISSMTDRQSVRFSSRVKVSYIALKSAARMFLTAAKSGGASCTGSGSFRRAAVYIS